MTTPDRPDDGALVTQAELLPCPFCGAAQGIDASDLMGVWIEKNDHDDPEYNAHCWSCGAGSRHTYSRDEAIAAWNARHRIASTPANTAQVAPDGWKLVPIEPTEAMVLAGESAAWDRGNSMPAIRAMPAAWLAMLSASPAQVASAPDRAGVEVEGGMIEMLTRDHARMRKAGGALAESATRVIHDYDGLHRLSLAVAEWMQAVAAEGDRPHPVKSEIVGETYDAVD